MEFKPGNTNQGLHVLMFPWLAHGHISAFLQLSRKLAVYGVNISFLSTTRNILKLKALNLRSKVQLLELALPSVDGLPPAIESTDDLPSLDMIALLKKAFDQLEKPFEALVRQISPDVVIFDVIQHWAPVVAGSLGIPSVFSLSYSAVSISYIFGHCKAENKEEITAEKLTKHPPDFPSLVEWRTFEARRMLPFYVGQGEGHITDMQRSLAAVQHCSAVAMKTCSEIENESYIKYIERIVAKPVLPLGPLLAYARTDPSQNSDSYCLRWLEKQEPASVVYVSFGTECPLSQHQIEEIAFGLENTKLKFVWALRVPERSQVFACLPSGFEDRTGDQGLVWREWAPQREIWFHSSTGGFLTHCGWNSLMEGMSAGLPLMLVPMQYDQGLNARLVSEELRIGVEVERDLESGYFSREDISKAVRKGMLEEDGMELRSNAAETGRVFNTKILCEGKDGVDNQCIEQFVKSLKSLNGGVDISQ